jgi:hypothetical protein
MDNFSPDNDLCESQNDFSSICEDGVSDGEFDIEDCVEDDQYDFYCDDCTTPLEKVESLIDKKALRCEAFKPSRPSKVCEKCWIKWLLVHYPSGELNRPCAVCSECYDAWSSMTPTTTFGEKLLEIFPKETLTTSSSHYCECHRIWQDEIENLRLPTFENALDNLDYFKILISLYSPTVLLE